MKITDIAMLFIFIIAPFIILMKINLDSLENSTYRTIELNRIIDTAVEDGASNLVEIGSNNELIINKERAVQTFFNTLSLNFNMTHTSYSNSRLMAYIPVIAIIDYDGYYILSNHSYVADDGHNYIGPIWKPKRYYTYDKDDYIYQFTLDSDVTVYEKSTNTFYEGHYRDVKKKVTSDIMSDQQLFHQIRKRTIVDMIVEDIDYYMNANNKVAKQYGITYHFSLPFIDKEHWYNTVDDVGMLVFFQGLPLGLDGQVYNHYALGGSRIAKGNRYFAEKDEDSGILYYHKEGCLQIVGGGKILSSQAECAKLGYIPCRICRP